MRPLGVSIAMALAVGVLLTSCGRPMDVAAVKKNIEDASTIMADAMVAGNIDKMVEYYAENATSMPPNNPALKGREAIGAYMKSYMEAGIAIKSVKFTTVEVDGAGMIAYEVGTYDWTTDIPEMGEMRETGKYMAVWKQQPDGMWKIHADIWNSDEPLPGTGQM